MGDGEKQKKEREVGPDKMEFSGRRHLFSPLPFGERTVKLDDIVNTVTN